MFAKKKDTSMHMIKPGFLLSGSWVEINVSFIKIIVKVDRAVTIHICDKLGMADLRAGNVPKNPIVKAVDVLTLDVTIDTSLIDGTICYALRNNDAKRPVRVLTLQAIDVQN